MSELKLKLHSEDTPDRVIIVREDQFTVGRLPECDLCLPFSEVSRYHTRFTRNENNEWLIEDLGSTNGTLLNQFQLRSPQALRNNDLIQIGNVFAYVILPMRNSQNLTLDGHNVTEGRTILRKADELKNEWINAEIAGTEETQETSIARLKYLVEIAQGLNSAESIEAIFSQVQEVVFNELIAIERLALLVDSASDGILELVSAADKKISSTKTLARDVSWISNSICNKAFGEKMAIKVVDAQVDQHFKEENSILSQGIRGALAVPLWDKSNVVGVLYADATIRLQDDHEPLADEDLSFFSTLANLVASSVQRWLLNKKLRGEEQIRQRLERYHSPGVVQKLLEQGRDDLVAPPVEADISIMFADIVGFTALSERLKPTEIAALLNSLFGEMIKSIFHNKGTLDKYIGDCIMAFFGAPKTDPAHPVQAVQAAIEMLKRLDQMNERKVWQEPLQLRIAINTGRSFVGDVGSSQRLDYTVLGPAVNLASRMESVCEPGECLISKYTYDRIDKYQKLFFPVGEGRFKGIDRPVLIYQTKRQRTRPKSNLS